MRLRDHLITSTLAGLVCYPHAPQQAILVVLAGVLIDLDHLAVYALHTGDWTISGALHYDRYRHRPPDSGDTRPRYGSLRSWLHHPAIVLPLLWWFAHRHPWLRPISFGLTLHLLLDHVNWPGDVYILWQAAGRCMHCNRRARLKVHYVAVKRGLPGGKWQAMCEECVECYTGHEQSQLSEDAVAVHGSASACQARLRGLDEAAQAAFAPSSRGL